MSIVDDDFEELQLLAEVLKESAAEDGAEILVEKTALLRFIELATGSEEMPFHGFYSRLADIKLKAPADGSKSIQLLLTTVFDKPFYSLMGDFYREQIVVRLRKLPILQSKPAPETPEQKSAREKEEELERIRRSQMHLPLDGDPNAGTKAAQTGPQPPKPICPECGGACYRGDSENQEPCEKCGGTGLWIPPDDSPKTKTCPECNGTRNVPDEEGAMGPCLTCHSTGVVPDDAGAEGADDNDVDDDVELFFLKKDENTFAACLDVEAGEWEWVEGSEAASRLTGDVGQSAMTILGGYLVPVNEELDQYPADPAEQSQPEPEPIF